MDYQRLLEITGIYYGLLEITGDYWSYYGLPEITGIYYGLLEITRNYCAGADQCGTIMKGEHIPASHSAPPSPWQH